MGFLDDLKVKGQQFRTKIDEMSDVSKVNAQIQEEQRAIQNTFSKLGEAYYQMKKDQPDDEFASFIAAVNDSYAHIEDLKAQLIVIRKVKVCPNCGTECDNTAMFCKNCGARLPELQPVQEEPPKAEEQAPSVKFCTNCGAQLKAEAEFCTNCGAKQNA